MRWPAAMPGGRVAAGRGGHPVVEIARRQRDVAGRSGGAARRVDPNDLGRRRAEMRADRIVGRARCPELVLVGQRQVRDVREPARRPSGGESRRRQLLAIEGRAVEEVGELGAIGSIVDGQLLCPRPGLDLGREHHGSGSSGRRRYSIASSALPAIRKPSGMLLLLGQMSEQARRAGENRNGLHGGWTRSPGRASPPRSASRRSSSAACSRPWPRHRGSNARAGRGAR